MGARVMIAAGGTGGHVFPALAVAERLRSRGHPVLWFGGPAGLEHTVVPAHGFELVALPGGAVRGRSMPQRMRVLAASLRAVARAFGHVRRGGPGALVAFGGYASVPAALAARLAGVPLVVHEQNAVAGLANRLLAPLATRVLAALPGAFRGRRRVIVTGNPVRAAIAAQGPGMQRDPTRAGALRLLVLGGSQGARALNACVPEALARLPAGRFEVWHQSGSAERVATAERYVRAGVPARTEAFIDDMVAAYRWADLAVCRAGAMTVAELAVCGLPAVLVPYPHAVDDHQSANARWLQQRGAALLVPEPELTAERLAAELAALAGERARLAVMSERARAAAMADATERVVAAVEEVLGDG